MNKLGIVLGATTLVVAAGCMDPNYELPGHIQSQNTPAEVGPATPEPTETDVTITDVVPVPEQPGCKCPPGKVHTSPCKCGAPDCQCIVEEPIMPPPPPPPVAVLEPEAATTTYIVQNGDYLAKISKKFNIKLDAIRKANPQLKDDKIRVGQKIQLPGKVDVGEQTLPARPRPAAPEYRPYSGPTKDYKVVSGDTLGKIAYSNGINIRQLKELNGLSGNNIRVGQTLKIPATKQEKPVAPVVKAPVKPTPVAKAPAKPAKIESKPVAVPVAPTPVPVVKETVAEPTILTPEPVVEPAPAEPMPEPVLVPEPVVAPQPTTISPANEDVITYVVQEGEDIAGVAVTFSVDPSVIRELNNLGPDEQLKPGQIVKIPASAL